METINSSALLGIDAEPIIIECAATFGQPLFIIVGLPDVSVQESRERIRAAFKHCSLSFPRGRVTVNLAPASVRKQGPSYDLPIALAILLQDQDFRKTLIVDSLFFQKALFCGELGLDGALRSIDGVLSIAMMARDKGFRYLFLPEENCQEASCIQGIAIIPLRSIQELILYLQGKKDIDAACIRASSIEVGIGSLTSSNAIFERIKGNVFAKRALEIAAAGSHNVLLFGPPGSGKTMLAQGLSELLPPLTFDEALEVSKIYSAGGYGFRKEFITTGIRPFRSPHHSSSLVSLVGGGQALKPGEISLAHRGVLFLDEFPEFPRSVIEALRQPLEEGVVHISRSIGSAVFPSRVMLVATQNPCPCGYHGDEEIRCKCSASEIERYSRKISGPILDRIDLCVRVPRIRSTELSHGSTEPLEQVRGRITRAQDRQRTRYSQAANTVNAYMSQEHLEYFCELEKEAQIFLHKALDTLHLSMRAYTRILKVARTIADLEGADSLALAHVAEALQFRHSASF